MKKSKFFNNSTKGARIETQAVEQTEVQTSRKSKRKVLRGFAFGGLALMMATAGVFAFAPLGVSADQMNTKANSESIQYAPSPLGLDPENDPVIFTTEDGIEIKWANDTSSSSINNSLPSGALAGYPYFTMGTYSSKAINWVIVAQNADTNVFGKPNSSYIFSSWKTTHNRDHPLYNTNAYYFFNNTYENTSPAGAAVDSSVSTSYVSDLHISTKPVIMNDIPSGCALAISETILCNSIWTNSSRTGPCYQLQGTMTSIYNSGGFSTFVNNGSLIYNGTFSNTLNSTTNYLFPLKQAHATALINGGVNLTAVNSSGTAAYYWLYDYHSRWKSDVYYDGAYGISNAGAICAIGYYNTYKYYAQYTAGQGCRPACIIKLN